MRVSAGVSASPGPGHEFESLRGHPFSGPYICGTTRIALTPTHLVGRTMPGGLLHKGRAFELIK